MIGPQIAVSAIGALAILGGGLWLERSAYERGKEACEAAVIIAANKELQEQQKKVHAANDKLLDDLERIKTNDALSKEAVKRASSVSCIVPSDLVLAIRNYEASLPPSPG